MIDPQYATGCTSFDKHTDMLSANGFVRAKTQFATRIPEANGEYDPVGRRLPSYVVNKAKATAPGGILYEFGNPATNSQRWRTHGWIAIDRHGTPLWVLSCPQTVCMNVMSALRTKLFGTIPMHVGKIRFPHAFNGDRASLAMAERQAIQETRVATRIARETKRATKRFHSETKRLAKLDLMDSELDEQLEAILNES